MIRAGLIRAREARKLTRPQLADMLGIDRTVLYKVELGIQDTGVEFMRRWVEALGPTASLDLFLPPKNAPSRAERERMERLSKGLPGPVKRRVEAAG